MGKTASLSPYISPVMTAVTSKMNRMVLLYTLILCMVSLPTSLPRHLLVETADKGGDDYSNHVGFPRPPPFYDYGMEKQNKGQDYRRGRGPGHHGGPTPAPSPSPSPNPSGPLGGHISWS